MGLSPYSGFGISQLSILDTSRSSPTAVKLVIGHLSHHPTMGKSIRPSLVLLHLVTSDIATWGLTEVTGEVKTKRHGAHNKHIHIHIFVTILQSMWTFTTGFFLKCWTTLINAMTFVILSTKIPTQTSAFLENAQ